MRAFYGIYNFFGEEGTFTILSKVDVTLSLNGQEPTEKEWEILKQVNCDDYAVDEDEGFGECSIEIIPLCPRIVKEVVLKGLPEEQDGTAQWGEREETFHYTLIYKGVDLQVNYSKEPHVGGIELIPLSGDEVTDEAYAFAQRKIEQIFGSNK